MQRFKLICRAMLRLLGQAWRFPRAVAGAFKRNRRRSALNLLELERLDRIRHPAKYLGKS